MRNIPDSRSSEVVAPFITGIISIAFLRAFLIVLLSVSFAVVVIAAFRMPVNADEYIFLNNIHRAVSGERLGLLQTAYVHLFQWLPFMGHNEITQNTIGRVICLAAWAGSLLLLYRLGRRLLDPLGALTSVVLFAVFTFSLGHAFTFRIEPLLLPLLLSVALLLLNPTTARVSAAGALSGVALALTIKTVLWAPAFIGVLAVGLWDSPHRLRPILAGAVAGTATYAGILLAHRWAISSESNPTPGVSVDGLASLGSYMLFEQFVPMSSVLLTALIANPATSTLLLIGFGLASASVREPQSRRNSLILLFLASPLLTLAFYTNAFPYAYLVLIPGACLLAGKAFSRLMGTAKGLRGVIALICLVSAAIPMIALAWESRVDRTQQQKQILSAVHQLFERPVPYIDVSGMVASFPRKIPVITRAVLAPYRRAGVPVFANYIHEANAPLLIVNSPSLDVWSDELESLEPNTRLLPQDEATIRATYAQYWDQIYLAGRQWRDLRPGERRSFEIVVPGKYTLLASGPVIVDGRTFAPGGTIALTPGPHDLLTTSAEADLRILYGEDLKLPTDQ